MAEIHEEEIHESLGKERGRVSELSL